MRKRVDGNQSSLLTTAKQLGAFNQSLTDVGGGCPDQIIAYPGFTVLGKDVTIEEISQRLKGLPVIILDGANILAEIKLPGEDLRSNQREWHERWTYYGGQVTTIKLVSEVLKLFGNK